MRAKLILLLLLLLPSCARQHEAPVAATPPSVCRLGPDGAAVAERGIGGTGGPVLADRGIGGTGGPSGTPAVRVAERGIGATGGPGSTGIIGVITGFASVCLNGLEVGLQNAPSVTIDGQPADATALRGGQFAAIDAGPELAARSIAIRHEVSGPVESIAQDGSVLQVAGQRVLVTDATLGMRPAQTGEWIAVSGLRIPGGAIDATRIDSRPPGVAIVHGTAVASDAGAAIGMLAVRPAAGMPPSAISGPVRVTGTYQSGVLRPTSVEPDLLGTDPAALLPRPVAHLVLESYASQAGRQLRFDRMEATAPPGMTGVTGVPSRAVFDLRRQSDGSYLATSRRDPGFGGTAGVGPASGQAIGGRGFEPAPVPHLGNGPSGDKRNAGQGARPSRRSPGGTERGGTERGGFPGRDTDGPSGNPVGVPPGGLRGAPPGRMGP